MRRIRAFTLAELLIALVILGVIATFTIPKVLTSQQSQKYNADTKETAGMLSGALEVYLQHNSISAGTTTGDFTPYMNYVRVDSTTTVDDTPINAAVSCGNANAKCLQLHNGSMLWYWTYVSFSGTATTNAVYYHLDPDGVTSNDKAINLFVYPNNKIRTEGEIDTNTCSSDGCRTPNPGQNPSWWNNWN